MAWWIPPSAFLIACFLSALLWDMRGPIVCFGLWIMAAVMAMAVGIINSPRNGQSLPDVLIKAIAGIGLLVAYTLPFLVAGFIMAAAGIAIRRKWRQAQKIESANAHRH